jgi:nucleotide-binding universal stress UspA family protein
MKSQKLNQLRKIMLAVDGSEHAWAAVDLLCTLPLSAETSIDALAALIPRQASLKSWALMHVLEATEALLQNKGVNVETELLSGYPAEELTKFATEHKPDLILLGAKGLRATMGILLGGVAQQIVEYACCPVLVVRAPYTRLRHVLLVIDSSPFSQRAAEFLTQFPLPDDTEVRVMHVLPPMDTADLFERTWTFGPEMLPPPRFYELEAAASAQAKEEERQGHTLLSHTLDKIIASGLDATSELLRGDAATEILDYVKTHEIDLVVAGCRGLSQVRGLLLGSVSRKLVHYAGCSVMIVKTPPK